MFVVDNLVRNMPHPDESRPKERMCVESDAPYQNLNVIKRLSKAKFPVYLASSKINGQHYAMKLFGYQKDKPHPYYVNEARFASLKHPNVIQIIYSEDKKDTLYKQELKSTSYILMEYAPHGDFFDLITKSKSSFDDRLVRTYFRQLIEGVEYLHSQGVAHLDLKPENLLVGKDYSLKIADFDLSHISGDKKVISKGTKYYRGPELFKCKVANPELKAPFATDIYSVAVILFVMKSGGIYPHCESDPLGGIYLADLLSCDTMEFWKKHCELQEREASYYEASFKDLFNGMTKCDPEERITIKEIKESEWYNGPVYSARELEKKVKEMLRC